MMVINSSIVVKSNTTNGVGFLIHKSIKETIIEFTTISSRICTIRITAKPLNIGLIQIYSPTSDYTEEQMENFYSQLQSTINSMKKKSMLIVQGDWNAKLGRIQSMTVVITVEPHVTPLLMT